MSLTLFFFPEFSWLENFGWGAHPIISNCGRKHFIKTILHPTDLNIKKKRNNVCAPSPKCYKQKTPLLGRA